MHEARHCPHFCYTATHLLCHRQLLCQPLLGCCGVSKACLQAITLQPGRQLQLQTGRQAASQLWLRLSTAAWHVKCSCAKEGVHITACLLGKRACSSNSKPPPAKRHRPLEHKTAVNSVVKFTTAYTPQTSSSAHLLQLQAVGCLQLSAACAGPCGPLSLKCIQPPAVLC